MDVISVVSPTALLTQLCGSNRSLSDRPAAHARQTATSTIHQHLSNHAEPNQLITNQLPKI
jgi:hypothetical protein